MKPKLNSTVSVIKLSDNIIEFFLTNTRQHVHLKVEDDTILNIVLSLDGQCSVEEIASKYDVKIECLISLFEYLRSKGILDNSVPIEDFSMYGRFRRVIHFLTEYAHSHEHLLSMWENIQNSVVLVVGVGAVGSWVAANLVQLGVNTIALMDPDVIDISNLHRQFGYTEAEVGKFKVDVLENRLRAYSESVKIIKRPEVLNADSLHIFDNMKIDLIINCADKPSVDVTSLWIGEYAMKRNIPHIIGGGYNLHLSLIGQTVLPGKSACLMCFRRTLDEENIIDPTKVKKLSVKNRKVGSFGPMCTLIASMIGMEAIKILSKCITPSNINRRGEFDIYNMDIKYKTYLRRDDCEWCGQNGKYYRS